MNSPNILLERSFSCSGNIMIRKYWLRAKFSFSEGNISMLSQGLQYLTVKQDQMTEEDIETTLTYFILRNYLLWVSNVFNHHPHNIAIFSSNQFTKWNILAPTKNALTPVFPSRFARTVEQHPIGGWPHLVKHIWKVAWKNK